MRVTESHSKAAGELVDLVANRVGSERAVHPETAIASAARLAGSLLFRSFNLDIQAAEPGTIVLSAEANEEGPQLISIMSAMLQHLGLSIDVEKLGGDHAKRGDEPQLSVVQSLQLLQGGALRIARANGLELEEAAHAAALATALIVKDCARDIGAKTSFNVAAYGFIEGCKTVPPPVQRKAKSADKRPWYKLW